MHDSLVEEQEIERERERELKKKKVVTGFWKMHSANHWGGSLDIAEDEDERSRHLSDNDLDRGRYQPVQQLDETQQGWLLAPNYNQKKKKKYVDLGCIVCSRKVFKWSLLSILIAFLVIGLPIIIVKTWPKPKLKVTPPDNYSIALKKALLFFDAQMSGQLPKTKYKFPWRGDSGLKDGSDLTDVKGGLVGGYYDAGDNIKFHFPMAFSMSMLSWTVIEYSHKYKAIGEYEHVKDIIKWGTDYLLLTFNSSATVIDKIYSQVGTSRNGSTTPDDHYCWQRPESMDYPRPVQTTVAGPDLAGEMAAALASASIVFRDDLKYSRKLIKGATALFRFARNTGKRTRYSRGIADIAQFYNSTDYYDEYMWGGAWMYYATGNSSYLALATNPGIPRHAHAFQQIRDKSVLSWDNKLPASQLLLTRLRIFLSPGYPYEDMLKSYHNVTGLNMCSYLRQFHVFNWTDGGMIKLNYGRPQPLQYVANAAFIASLYVDYMNATGVPGWFCGPFYIDAKELHRFATSQVDYILGANPMKMSYLVGYGDKFPMQVHHRGASIPNDKTRYSCTDGWKWRDSPKANPHNITGAMVGGPDRFDKFHDVRKNYNYTEPTLAGNAGLVAALISLTTSGGNRIDKNTIFSAVPPLYPVSRPPPPPWKP